MADTSFVARVTTIAAAWLNPVNWFTYWGRSPNFATTTGAANAQILTLATGSLYTSGSEADGDEFWFKAGFTNTGAMTLQIIPPSGTNTARAVELNGQALVGGEVQSGLLYKVSRLSSTWQLHGPTQLTDGLPLIVNAADITKKLKFALSAITTATIRTWTWQDASDTVVGRATTDTLTNKTLTNPAQTTQALVDGANIAWDMSLGQIATVTLGGNRTMSAPSNLKTGGRYVLIVTQDATGGRTLAFNAVYKGQGASTIPNPTSVPASFSVYIFTSPDGVNLNLEVCNLNIPVSFSAYKSLGAGAQTVTDGAFTKITFDTEEFDIGGYFATSAWTPPAGKYLMGSMIVGISVIGDQNQTGVALYKNAANFKTLASNFASGSLDTPGEGASVLVDANGTDVFDIRFFQSTGADRTITGAQGTCYFWGVKVG